METEERDVVENAPEDQFAYAAADVFSIVSPYVFHTHAPRVFSEISEALRGAQQASADVVARLEASERAQEQERALRALGARQYVARLRELQALMTARVEREITGAKARKSLKRKLGEEVSRSAQLEKRLADTEEELRRLRKEFDTETCALEDRWRSTLEQAVVAAREAERAKASRKVEAVTVKRLRSLSSEVTKLKGKLVSVQLENSSLLEILRSFIPPPSRSPSSLQRRAEEELHRLSAAAAAVEGEESESRGGSAESAGNYSSGSGLGDMVSGLTDRIKHSISERASELGLPQWISRRRVFSDEEDDGSYAAGDGSVGLYPSLPPPVPVWQGHRQRHRQRRQQQQPQAAQRREREAAAAAAPVAPAAVAAAATTAGSGSPFTGRESTRRSSGSSSSSRSGISSGRRRGLGSSGGLNFEAAGANASRGPAHNPASGWVPSGGGSDPARANPASGETLKSSSRWQHQRPLGGGGGETGAGWNAPSLHALLASGDFYPAGGGIAGAEEQAPPVRAASSLRWSGGRGAVELRDHNNNPSRFAERGEGWVTGEKPGVEADGDEREEEAGVETSAQEDGSGGCAAAAAAAGMTSACAGGEDGDAGGIAPEVARAAEAHPAQNDDADADAAGDGLSASVNLGATRHGGKTGAFSRGAGHKKSGGSRGAGGTVDACGGGGHGAVGDSGRRVGPALEMRPDGALLCSAFSATVYGGGAKHTGNGRGDGDREKRLDDLFPPMASAGAGEVGAATTTVATGEDAGKQQRPALDDLLRDMAVAVPVEAPGEGDNAGGSVVAPLPRRADFVDMVLA